MTSLTLNTSDGFVLSVDYEKVEESTQVVIFAHGMTVNMDDEGIFVKAARKLKDLHISTIRFDFRAHGKSTGKSEIDFTISGELIDLDTIMKFVQDEGYKKIGLAGASFGGGISALYAGEHATDIDALVLANPALDYKKCFLNPTTTWAREHFSDLDERLSKDGMIKIGSRQFGAGAKLFEEMKEYFPHRKLSAYNKPLLIVHGTKDSKVAYDDAYEVYQQLDNPLKRFETIDGSEHGFHGEQYENRVTRMIADFFKEQL
mgnify:FL=1